MQLYMFKNKNSLRIFAFEVNNDISIESEPKQQNLQKLCRVAPLIPDLSRCTSTIRQNQRIQQNRRNFGTNDFNNL